MICFISFCLLLGNFFGDSKKSFALLVNRIPIGQIEQPIHLTRSKIGCEEVKKGLKKKRVEFIYNTYEYGKKHAIEFQNDSIEVHHNRLRDLYKGDLEKLELKYEPSHFLRGSKDYTPSFDSLYFLLEDTTFFKCEPSNFIHFTNYYSLHYFDPAPIYGKDICRDYFEVYKKFLTYSSFLPMDSVKFVSGLRELESALIPFVKKYPQNPYCYSVFFFLERSFRASLNRQTPRSYFDELFLFISNQAELYDKSSVDLVNSLLKGFHKRFNVSKAESKDYFGTLGLGKPRNEFHSIYTKFLESLK